MATFADASWSARAIFLSYMVLWTVYGVLNQYGSIHGIRFDPMAVVWSQEVLKIIISLGLYFVQDGSPRAFWKEAREHWTLIFWYGIPASLYALGDVLTYVLLRSFDPATLTLLGEMKIVLTAVVHQTLFKRMLKRWHWAALGIITAGCIVKAVDSMEVSVAAAGWSGKDGRSDGQEGRTLEDAPNIPHPTAFDYSLIFVNILMSTVAGVYNEKLLKDKPTVSINLQNICLYLDGTTFLAIGMAAGLSGRASLREALSPSSLGALFSRPSVLGAAVTMSVVGVVTSRFLRAFDSIWKSVAAALVVVSLPFASRLFFGTAVTAKMVLSILLVLLGMCIYTTQPPPTTLDTGDEEDGDDVEVCGNEDNDAELYSAVLLQNGVDCNEEIGDGIRLEGEEVEMASGNEERRGLQ